MLKACIAAAGVAIAGSAAIAVDKPVYDVAYEAERGSFINDITLPTQGNNSFDNRESHTVTNLECFYLSGKLHANDDPGRYPDTYLFMFDKFDNVVCEDNDSSNKGNGKASACFGVAPIPNGDDANATVRLGITGRPDGIDNMFNGLFFNAPHEQLGEATVCVTYYDAGGMILDTDTYLCTFVTGAEAFRVNYVVPANTATVDVEIDNTTEYFDVCNDVDFYQLEGLSEACDYAITVIGGMDENCEPNCAVLGWYDKNGNLVDPAANNPGWDDAPAAQLSVITDANGRIRFAVSGHGDKDFDGFLLSEGESAWEGDDDERTIGTPGYDPPPVHDCCTCYTVKVEINKHVPDDGGSTGGDSGTMLNLANGDLNIDGSVNVIDLAMMLNNWGWTAP